MIAPQDQRGTFDSSKEFVVAPGAHVPVEVEAASDLDTLTPINGPSTEELDEVSYKWEAVPQDTASGKGTWQWEALENGQLVPKTGETAPTAKATWIAPNNVAEEARFTLKCTIDDKPLAIDPLTHGGVRGDEPIEHEVKVKMSLFKVKFEGQLIKDNTLLRAAAGGVDDHKASDPTGGNDFQYRAHTRAVSAIVTYAGQPAINSSIKLVFEGNKGHDYGNGKEILTAKLHRMDEIVDATHPWKDSIELTTDNQGKAHFWVKSSDVVCQPTLKVLAIRANQGEIKIGELACSFAASDSKRRFQDLAGNDDGDNGWLFYFPNQQGNDFENGFLADPGDTMPAKIYLKFKIDDTKEDNYINEHGQGNWQYVNQHSLVLSIESINTPSDSSDAEEIDDTTPDSGTEPPANPDYVDPNPEPITLPDGEWQDPEVDEPGDVEGDEVDDADTGVIAQELDEIKSAVQVDGGGLTSNQTTGTDGGAQCLLRAQSGIGRVKKITMAAIDTTVWDD
jgi:hypothetical protein